MKDPPAKGDPDKMTSPNYTADLALDHGAYPDSGGVHQNSGVGNKTAYLISQGGPFNGQTITGIDGADTGLTKTGKLYFDAITKLTSGSDYANLASVLEQSCADFVDVRDGRLHRGRLCQHRRGRPCHRAADDAHQRSPAGGCCRRAVPTGTTLRELLNSETGDVRATKFTGTGGLWSYGVDDDWGSNATSGRDSWFGATRIRSPMVPAACH